MDFTAFEEQAGISFVDKSLLKQAFTHRSYLNENRSPSGGSSLSHNERLEFLGDAVLELVITDFLYSKFPEMDEGGLPPPRGALVNPDPCAPVAEPLGENAFLPLPRGESKDPGRARQYILANTLEALIGALYEDQ